MTPAYQRVGRSSPIVSSRGKIGGTLTYPAPHGKTARRLEWSFLPPHLRAWIERVEATPVMGDAEKTARTIREIEGVRWTIPGDYATVEADRTLTLLGRGSVCINTGGEKVFAEEVEQALKHHPDVFDVVVVGRPSERWGQEIVALVQPQPDAAVDAEALARACTSQLARFKAPKEFIVVDKVRRLGNGKATGSSTPVPLSTSKSRLWMSLSTCMPPSEPPTAACSRSMPRC